MNRVALENNLHKEKQSRWIFKFCITFSFGRKRGCSGTPNQALVNVVLGLSYSLFSMLIKPWSSTLILVSWRHKSRAYLFILNPAPVEVLAWSSRLLLVFKELNFGQQQPNHIFFLGHYVKMLENKSYDRKFPFKFSGKAAYINSSPESREPCALKHPFVFVFPRVSQCCAV